MKAHHVLWTLCLTLPMVGAAPNADPAAGNAAIVPPTTRPATRPDAARAEALARFAPTEQDIKDAAEFLQTTCPNHWKVMEKRNVNVNRFMVMRFLELRRLKSEDPALYALRMDEMRMEDEIFPLVQQLHGDPQNQSIRDQVRKASANLLDLRIKECERRVAKLNEAIATEQKVVDMLHGPEGLTHMMTEEMNKANNLLGPPGGGPGPRREHATKPEVSVPATQPNPTP